MHVHHARGEGKEVLAERQALRTLRSHHADRLDYHQHARHQHTRLLTHRDTAGGVIRELPHRCWKPSSIPPSEENPGRHRWFSLIVDGISPIPACVQNTAHQSHAILDIALAASPHARGDQQSDRSAAPGHRTENERRGDQARMFCFRFPRHRRTGICTACERSGTSCLRTQQKDDLIAPDSRRRNQGCDGTGQFDEQRSLLAALILGESKNCGTIRLSSEQLF